MRVQAQRLAEMLHGSIQISLGGEHASEVMMSVRVVGIQLKRALEIRGGLFQLALAHHEIAEVEMGLTSIWLQLDRFSIMVEGFVRVAQRKPGVPDVVINGRIAATRIQGF